MKAIKTTAITLLVVLTVPLTASFINSFCSPDTEIVFCETPNEEEQKDEREIDALEEYLLGEHPIKTIIQAKPLLYSFRGKSFIDIVTDIVTPPPEQV